MAAALKLLANIEIRPDNRAWIASTAFRVCAVPLNSPNEYFVQ